MFITFEGIDFCGKSTQVRLLEEYLLQQNKKIKIIREPGGTFISEKIRDILLDKENEGMNIKTELLLFAASRAQLVNDVIKPYLEDGYFVIADRLHDSSIAYQGYGRGIDLDFVINLQKFVLSGVNPDVTFFLDIHVEDSDKRKQNSGRQNLDRIELSQKMFYEKVRDGYNNLADKFERIKKIDGLKPIEDIRTIIVRELQNLDSSLKGVE